MKKSPVADPVPDALAEKQEQFNAAMARHAGQTAYSKLGKAVSLINVSLQVVLAVLVIPQSVGPLGQALAFAAAYVLADFVNGLVHMYMDNNADYASPAGPLVAAFHLHHRTPLYKVKALPRVYYDEAGSKLWLAAVEVLAVLGVGTGLLAGAAAYGVLYFAVLSTLAEVSHYLCHVPQMPAAAALSRMGLLLSKRHHARHHTEDNIHYAFLNGMTDPVLNIIAKLVYPGYKQTTDLHYAAYRGGDTENRA